MNIMKNLHLNTSTFIREKLIKRQMCCQVNYTSKYDFNFNKEEKEIHITKQQIRK